MTTSSAALEQLSYENATRLSQETARQWKQDGRHVIGWVCTYAPEELIDAAGMLPIRIMGSPEPHTIGDSYLQANMCAFVRSCLAQGLKGNYAHLDGVLYSHTCDTMCKLYDLWRLYVKPAFAHQIDHPHKVTPASATYHLKEVQRLKSALEGYVGHEIDDRDLRRAIDVANENRRLLREIYALRKSDPPAISGVEAYNLVRASMILPKDQINATLRQLLVELSGRKVSATGPRLLVAGSEMDTPDFVQLVEDCGAVVVADDLCVGTRYFWTDTSSDGEDALAELSRRYLNKTPCACVEASTEGRLEHMLTLAREYNVQGVIFFAQKFCDTYAYDFVRHRPKLEDLGLPVLQVEVEHCSVGVGQMKTRVQAFIEMLS